MLGFALDEPGDLVMAGPSDAPGVTIVDVIGDGGRLPRDATAEYRRRGRGSAAGATCRRRRGMALTIHKGLPLESGIGSSGASAVAAVVAANELLGRPVGTDVLLACAMAGEQAGCGAAHPDNVAPALLGGFVLARNIDPPDVVRLPVPDGLACALLHPHLPVHTGTARALLGDSAAARDRGPAVGQSRRAGRRACSPTTGPCWHARSRTPSPSPSGRGWCPASTP